MESKTGSLLDALAAALPADSEKKVLPKVGTPLSPGFKGKMRYIHTPSKPCEPLFSPPPGHEPEKTRMASHFLTFSVHPRQTAGSSISITADMDEDVVSVLGIGLEIYVYTTKHLTTIFVSKADTSGYIPNHPPSRTKIVCTTFIRWLVEQERSKHPSRKVVVSLFARSQAQYLFPGSVEHSSKHVLDDRQLIKWWAKVLDPLLDLPKDGEEASDVNGYLTIPGYDAQELRSYLPRTEHRPGCSWKAGNPLAELADARSIPAGGPPRSLLPRFPDDPKARFMQELDDEVGLAEGTPITVSPSKRKSGKWNNVGNLDRFWEAMEFRQECSSGRVVGFLWVVIAPTLRPISNGKLDTESGASHESTSGHPSSDSATGSHTTLTPSAQHSPSRPRSKRKPLTGPVIPRQPRLKGGSSSLTATSTDLNGMLNSLRGESLLMSKEAYDKALQTLLHLDFANLDVAAKSTGKWVAEVASMCGLAGDWATEVVGTAKNGGQAGQQTDANGADGGGSGVNDLGGMVRKKRKAGDAAAGMEPVGGEAPAVNVLSAGALRKKPKPAAS